MSEDLKSINQAWVTFKHSRYDQLTVEQFCRSNPHSH